MQGLFFGLGQMQGLGLQHLHGMGFIMAKLEAPDGLPVFSGPSYIEIVSTRAGVGAGQCPGIRAVQCLALPFIHSSTLPLRPHSLLHIACIAVSLKRARPCPQHFSSSSLL